MGIFLISKIYREDVNGKARLIFDVTENGQPKQIFFEVEEKYGEYLCYERCDAIVVGLLRHVMHKGFDIKSEVPITEELLYNLNEYLIPALTKYDARLATIKIDVPTAEALPNAGSVGTGLSCGVDSFHSILSHTGTPYASRNVTHLQINNVGDFAWWYSKAKAGGKEGVKKDCYERARKVAEELNLPLVETDSNLPIIFPQNQVYTHAYTAMFAVYCLQKLWKTYYYASTYELKDFSLKNNAEEDTAYYEIFALNCLSTDKLRNYSGGAALDRLEKVARIADNKVVQENLHVCWKESHNCNQCPKCRRTILELYALGKLEKFGRVFDVDYFKNNKNEYLIWLYNGHSTGDTLNEPTYRVLEHEIKIPLRLISRARKIASVIAPTGTLRGRIKSGLMARIRGVIRRG